MVVSATSEGPEETGVASEGATVADVARVVRPTVEVKPSPVATTVPVMLLATTLAPGVPLRPLRTVEPVWVTTAPAASVMVVVKRLVVTAVGVAAPPVEVPAPAVASVGAAGVSVCGWQLVTSYQPTNCSKHPRTYDGRDRHAGTSAHTASPLHGEVHLILVVGAVGPGAVVDTVGEVGIAAEAGHVVGSAAKVSLAEHVLGASSLGAGQ